MLWIEFKLDEIRGKLAAAAALYGLIYLLTFEKEIINVMFEIKLRIQSNSRKKADFPQAKRLVNQPLSIVLSFQGTLPFFFNYTSLLY